MAQSIDGMVDNSSTLQALSSNYLDGSSDLLKEVGSVLSSPSLGASNLRDVSLTALLTHLLGSASGERRTQLEQMLAAAQKLNDEGSN